MREDEPNAMSTYDINAPAMTSTERHRALEECATICRDIMREEDAGARADTPEERRDINRHALRCMRYGTAKQILERIAALPSE